MMRKMWLLGCAITLSVFFISGNVGACESDNISRVSGGDECLVIKTGGSASDQSKLLIFIHGDGSRGGASDYLFPNIDRYGGEGIVAVGLIRPGYYDSHKNRSSGTSYRQSGDGYRPHIVEAVASAVRNLKRHYDAKTVILIGHSGGAAISGVILGKYPGLVDRAVLAACPCNVADWRIDRRGRNNWTRSLSPHDYVETVSKAAKVMVIAGESDLNVKPFIAENYVAALVRTGVDAKAIIAPNKSHNHVVKSEEFHAAIAAMLAD